MQVRWASASASIGGKTVSASQDGSALIALINLQGQATWAKVIPGNTMADDVALGPDGKAYMVGPQRRRVYLGRHLAHGYVAFPTS